MMAGQLRESRVLEEMDGTCESATRGLSTENESNSNRNAEMKLDLAFHNPFSGSLRDALYFQFRTALHTLTVWLHNHTQ